MAPLIEERIEILERRLLQQESINEIRGVLGSYCKAIDARNPDALSPLLCEEISLVVTPWEIDIKGRAAVTPAATQLPPPVATSNSST